MVPLAWADELHPMVTDQLALKDPERARIAKAACPGVLTERADGWECSRCPVNPDDASGFDPENAGAWSVGAVYVGRFTKAGVESALVSVFGCQLGRNPRSALVMERVRGVWTRGPVYWLQQVDDCRKLRAADGHDLALCLHGEAWMGVITTALLAIDYAKDGEAKELIQVYDNLWGGCMGDTVHQGTLEAVEVRAGMVTVRHREGELALTEAMRADCANLPEIEQAERVDRFRFDGSGFTRVEERR